MNMNSMAKRPTPCHSYDVCKICAELNKMSARPPSRKPTNQSMAHPSTFDVCKDFKKSPAGPSNNCSMVCTSCVRFPSRTAQQPSGNFDGSCESSDDCASSKQTSCESYEAGNYSTSLKGQVGSSCNCIEKCTSNVRPSRNTKRSAAIPSCDSFNVCRDCARFEPSNASSSCNCIETCRSKTSKLDRSVDSFKARCDNARINKSGVHSTWQSAGACNVCTTGERASSFRDSFRTSTDPSCDDSTKLSRQESDPPCNCVSECRSSTRLSRMNAQRSKVDPSCDSFDVCEICALVADSRRSAADPSCDSFDVCDLCAMVARLNEQSAVTSKNQEDDSCRCVEKCGSFVRTSSQSAQKTSRENRKTATEERKPPTEAIADPPSSVSSSDVKEVLQGDPIDLTAAEESEGDETEELADPCENLRGTFKGAVSRKSKSPGRTLYRTKTANKIPSMECPPNPCESMDKAKARLSRKSNVVKRNTMKEKSRASKSQKSVEDVDSKVEEDEATSARSKKAARSSKASIDESQDADPSAKQSEGCEDFSKKYQKMKYEIELQNYVIDKINRDLQLKTRQCRSKCELQMMNQRLDSEVRKLRELVQFAICMQRESKAEKWGPIPISPVGDDQMSRSTQQSRGSKLKPPKTPSGLSAVSGFEELDNVMAEDDREPCDMQQQLQMKDVKIQEIRQQLRETECQLQNICETNRKLKAGRCEGTSSKVKFNKNTKCEELFDMKTSDVNHLDASVKSLKCKIEKIRKDFCGLKPSLSKALAERIARILAEFSHQIDDLCRTN